MLTIEGLTTSYGPVRALEDVSFAIDEGRLTAVLGANGAGKTSLLRTISGLVRARSGTIRLGERDIGSLAVEEIVRLGVSHVPEGRGVIAELTVEENLRLGGLWRDRSGGRTGLKTVYELFPRLEERRERHASTLSGGERQMLAIGRALMAQPKLLLLDEPSLGLAPQVAAQIMRTLRDLRERDGLTVLLVEQNARAALSVADHGVVLNVGRVVGEGNPEQLESDDRLREAYLGI